MPEVAEMKERVYVAMDTEIDETGFMMPRSIVWEDGRTFQIDRVTGFRRVSGLRNGMLSIYYTVAIGQEIRILFFQRTNECFTHVAGRWFVERESYKGSAGDGEAV